MLLLTLASITTAGAVVATVFAPHFDREFEYLRLDEYYTFYLCVGFYDEEGTFKALSNGNRSDIYIS